MKAYIFDLDGVVVDTAKYHYLAWKKLAEELGFHFDIKHNERLKGVSRMESLNIVLETGNMQGMPEQRKIELAEQKNDCYLKMIDKIDESEILPGIPEFLNKLRKNGYKIALGSASKSGKMILEKLKLTELFDQIVDGNIVQNPKPDPEVFLTAAKLMQVPPGECTVVEDASAGVEAAHAGGMRCIGVGDSEVLSQADIVVANTSELNTIEV